MAETLGVILAGGRATRMGGGDKCLLRAGGRVLLDHIIDRLAGQVGDMVLNANGDPARFVRWGLPVVPDADGAQVGPLAGVLAGMDAAAACGARRIATVAGDTPFFPRTLVHDLAEAAEAAQTPLAMAATPDPERGVSRHPTFALWPVELREDLRAALAAGTRKVVAWTDPHGCATAMFPADPVDPFFNVNTPGDLARADALALELAR